MRSSVCLLPMLALSLQVATAPVGAAEATDVHYLAVVANSEVRARPDRGIVQLGVETQAETAQAAMARNNEAMSKILEALKKLGIPEDNLQTSQVSLEPVYVYPQSTDPRNPPPPPQRVGFKASNFVAAELHDLNKVGPAVDAGVAAGGNNVVIRGIAFRLSDEQPFKVQALRQAAGRARAKGEALAAGLQVAIERVNSASEIEYQVVPVDRVATPAPAGADGTSTPVLPGQLVVRAQVQVKFIIR